MASNKNYAQGVFAKEFQTQYGMMIGLNIYKDEFINWLDSLPVNENGQVKLAMAPAQEQDKWTVFESVSTGGGNRNNRGGSQRGGNSRGGQRQAPQQYARQGGGQQRQAPRNQQPARGQRQAMQNPFVNDQDEADDSGLPF